MEPKVFEYYTNSEDLIALVSAQNSPDTISAIEKLISDPNVLNSQNAEGRTALMFACLNSDNIVEMLINAGANVNLRTNREETALLLSALHSSTTSNNKIVELLINANADIDATDEYGWTAMSLAVLYSDSKKVT